MQLHFRLEIEQYFFAAHTLASSDLCNSADMCMASKIPSNSLLVVCINLIAIFSLINLIIALDVLVFFSPLAKSVFFPKCSICKLECEHIKFFFESQEY